tara:strand:- start:392 stop:550 length:159 start_codon:yes stop_codon:yes gene_type:complete
MTKTRLLMEVDAQVKNEFRAKCIREGKTMKDVLTEFMKNYNPKKKGGIKKKK